MRPPPLVSDIWRKRERRPPLRAPSRESVSPDPGSAQRARDGEYLQSYRTDAGAAATDARAALDRRGGISDVIDPGILARIPAMHGGRSESVTMPNGEKPAG